MPVLTTAKVLAAVRRQDEIRKQSVVIESEGNQNQVHPEPTAEPTKKDDLNSFPKKTFAIPKTLLQQPLTPEVLNQLNETDRRLYEIQKNKWEARQKQLKKTAQKPSDINFTIEDAKTFELGNFHEEQQDEEEQEVVIEARNKTNYFVRDEDFYQSKLEDFDKTINFDQPHQPRF